MKVCFLLTQLEVGGAQTRVLQTATVARAAGHKCDVVFLYEKRTCFEEHEKTILHVGKPRGVRELLGVFMALLKHLRSEKYDAIVCNTGPANIIGTFAGLLSGIAKRYATQTQPPKRLGLGLRGLDLIWCVCGIYTYSIANSRWTQAQFDGYPKLYRRNLRLVENGISPKTFLGSRVQARMQFGLLQDEFVVVSVGRLSVQKDHQTIIRAMTSVDGRLLIAGEGELRAELETLIVDLELTDRVELLGELDGPSVSALIAAGDVYACPSRWETFGLAVVEAAMTGIPLVCSDLEVLREVLTLEDGRSCGLFAKTELPQSFADAFNELKNRRDTEEALHLGSELAEQRSIGRHVEKLFSLIGERK